MKVVILGPFHPFRGGIAHFGGCLYDEFQRQNIPCSPVNFRSQYPAIIFPGKSQYEEDGSFSHIPSSRALTPYNPFTFKRTLRTILKEKPDLVIFNYFIPVLAPAYTYLLKKMRRHNTPTLLITHNVISHEKWLFASYLTKRMLCSAAKIMTLSQSVFSEAAKIVPKDTLIEGFHPLYSFYNKNRYTREQAKESLALKGSPVILFFGYIKPYKGLEMLINSFPYIKRAYPEAVLLIVGEIYGDKRCYIDLISKSEFKNDIILKDEYVSNNDVEAYFKSADLLALPYLTATQSGVIQIAYSMDIGAVVTPVGGLPEIIIAGKTGTVSKAITPVSYADAVIEFLSLDKTSVSLEITRYREQMSWERLVKMITEIPYNEHKTPAYM